MAHITFATGAASVSDLEAIYMLGRSIRDFGGGLSRAGLHVYIPEAEFEGWKAVETQLLTAGILLHMIKATKEELAFLYAFKSLTANAAEQDIGDGTVVWMDRHSLVVGDCADFVLNPWEHFAYRPVNIRNIASLYGGPINGFWKDAFDIAGIAEGSLFPVFSSVDRQKITPYFFACLFVFRPADGLMASWKELFETLQCHPQMKKHLQAEKHRIYLHQAALCLAALKNIPREAMRELPFYYGYPLHLHGQIPELYRVSSMDRLNTAYFSREQHDWQKAAEGIAVSQGLGDWLTERIREAKSLCSLVADLL